MSNKARRKKAMDIIFKPLIKRIGLTDGIKFQMEVMEGLSDKAFTELMRKCKNGEYIVPFFADNFSNNEATMDMLLDICDDIGAKAFEQVYLIDETTGEETLTPLEYPIGYSFIRRLIQHLKKGLAVAEHNSSIDTLTGQVAGDSKVSRLSIPEISMLRSKGYTNTILEGIKIRGGDKEAYGEMLKQVEETGDFSIKSIQELNSRPQSTKTVSAILFSRHLENNVVDKV